MEDLIPMAGADLWYHGTTVLHPAGIGATVLCALALLFLPRHWALVPIVVMACFVSPAQRIVVGPFDLNLLRILVLIGWVRVLARGEVSGFCWKSVDLLIILWAIAGAAAYTLLRMDAAALINRLGWMFDGVGMYFLCRMLLRGWDDVLRLARTFAVLSVPAAAAFVLEWMTGRNIFSVLGGVPEFTVIREGRLRCQGPFPHAIMAGCFWAAALPLMACLWWQGVRERGLALVGAGLALLIVVLTASATPVSAVIFAGVGGAAFVLRAWMGWIRLAVLAALVMLHFVMIAPVWHLIARVSVVSGATGWHRFHLIDRAIENVEEWWLMGTLSTAHWGFGLQDVTNQYILEGVRGGLLTLSLFSLVIILSFRNVGLLWRWDAHDHPRQILAWALGVMLFVHVTSFIGVSYFGQINMLWFLSLAMITSMAAQSQAWRVSAGHAGPPTAAAPWPGLPALRRENG
jgi:hypothetical protein